MIPVFSADPELVWLFSSVAALLVMATSAGLILKVSLGGEAAQATMVNVMARIRAWWVLAAVFVTALAIGHAGLRAQAT